MKYQIYLDISEVSLSSVPQSALQHFGSWRHICSNPHITSDDCTPSYSDTPQYGAIAIHHYPIFEYGMTLHPLYRIALRIERKVFGTKGNTLIQGHMIANNTRGTYHNARTMINGKRLAYHSCRVYIDTCLTMCHLSNDTWDEGYTLQVQFMSQAIIGDGAYAWIAADDLAVADCRRVALKGSYHIGSEDMPHMWQALYTPRRNARGMYARGLACSIKTETCQHLLGELAVQQLNIDTHTISHHATVDTRVSIVSGKEYSAKKRDDIVQLAKRRQWLAIAMCMKERSVRMGSCKITNHPRKNI